MKTFKTTAYSWDEVVFQKTFVAESEREALYYEYGVFAALKNQITGVSTEEVQ